jgi:hypothetical protein
MRRTLKLILVAAALLSTPVFADDPPPATSDTPTESTFRHSGALLDRSPQRRSQMLSVFLGIPVGYYGYYGGFPFGLGGRYLIPILHDGFIPSVNDSFNIEFGVDFSGVLGAYFYPVLSIPVEVMWQFHFTQKFSAYAKIGVALEFNFVSYCSSNVNVPCRGVVTPGFVGNIGLMYKFSEKISFRAEAGYPWLKVGLGFDM